MIRKCNDTDSETILDIINDAAEAYRGVIPADRWHEPYMSCEELQHEIEAGVSFWGFEDENTLIGVMGIQDKGDVTLIRHAYVRSSHRNRGIGTRLLRILESTTGKPILVGTWADAAWAIAFYQKNGYRLLLAEEKRQLLKKYWTIPERQVETSVVLANPKWRGSSSY
ncbi:MAG: GNAT family N-acetyltransferase [Deltaproteobacteria bacterium RBG_16_48_10]|nr:MAG: GNAT family N-acetyltransferase [Deltaproteobacteria bacterium RBG_16_48_10]